MAIKAHERALGLSSQRDKLISALREIFSFMKEQSVTKSSLTAESKQISEEENSVDFNSALENDTEIISPEVIIQADEQTIQKNRGGESGMFLRSGTEGT